MPVERAVLGRFCELIRAADVGTNVGDIGCGTGRLEPCLTARGLAPRGIDLSPEMIRVARRDYPEFSFDIADMRDLPFEDASLAGVVCWYSLMFLAPSGRPAAFRELARVVKPGGYLVTAFKAVTARGTTRRAQHQSWRRIRRLLVGPDEMERRVTDAGFATVFWDGPPRAGAGGLPARRSACPEVLNSSALANIRSSRRRVCVAAGSSDFPCGQVDSACGDGGGGAAEMLPGCQPLGLAR